MAAFWQQRRRGPRFRGAGTAHRDPWRVRHRPIAVHRPTLVSGIFLAAYLFPAILMAIPLFVGFTRLGLRGNLVGLIIVYTAQTVPVAIYMLRNYFETVPEAIEEAGLVDGLTRMGVLSDQLEAGPAVNHVHRIVRVHDRVERVLVRAAVPR